MSLHRLNPELVGISPDPSFAKSTETYQSPLAVKGQKTARGIFAAMTDTGAARAMLPALEILAENTAVKLVAREAALDVVKSDLRNLKQKGEMDLRERLERIREGVVFTGMASNPALELLANMVGNEKNKPVAAIEDYPGAYGVELRKQFTAYPNTMPNRLMVMSEWAKDANATALPNMNRDKIYVTGQPAFDYIATEDRAGIKKQVYEQAGILNSDRLVVWMGQKGGTKEAFEMLIDGLSEMPGDFRLAIRRHPRDVVPMEQYEELAGKMRPRLVRTDGIPTSEVGAAGDVVATIFSTEGLSSVLRGIPTLHILTPEILERTEVPGIVVPVVEDGSSHVIRDGSKSRLVIAELFNPNANADRQEAVARWKPDGMAAVRVADTLANMARGRM